jgi:hypothetical protein
MIRLNPIDDRGFMSVSALLACAALGLICAGLLSLATAQRRQSQNEMQRFQREEAMRAAIMHLGIEVLSASATRVTIADYTAKVQDVDMKIDLRAESEVAKWPLSQSEALISDVAASKTRLTLPKIKDLLLFDPELSNHDCLRSLFSEKGQASVTKPEVKSNSDLVAVSREGEIWRLKAAAGGQIIEQKVRYLGDPKRTYAVISDEVMSINNMPQCKDLIEP